MMQFAVVYVLIEQKAGGEIVRVSVYESLAKARTQLSLLELEEPLHFFHIENCGIIGG